MILVAKMITGEEIMFQSERACSEIEWMKTNNKIVDIFNPKVLPEMDNWLKYMDNHEVEIESRNILVCRPECEITPILVESYKELVETEEG